MRLGYSAGRMSRSRLILVSLLVVVAARLWFQRVWVWNRLPEFRPGTLEIRDIVGLCVAGLALLLSWFAIQMARRQEAMMVEQGKIVDKQLEMMTLEVETGKRIEAISKRQAEIAEAQHQIFTLQQSKVADLRIRVSGLGQVLVEEKPALWVSLSVYNDGSRAAHGFSTHLFTDPDLQGKLRFQDEEGNNLQPQIKSIAFDRSVEYIQRINQTMPDLPENWAEPTAWMLLNIDHPGTVFRKQGVPLCRMLVSSLHAPETLVVSWRMKFEDRDKDATGIIHLALKDGQYTEWSRTWEELTGGVDN